LAIRLVGPSPCEGRVEVYHNQYWGTICATFWDLNISSVVCRELNCGTAVEASDNGKYQHYGHSWNYSGLSFFQCRGNESELLSCTYEVFPHHHKPVNDGGVKCTDLQVRLVGPSPCEGRVEIFYAQKWGTICYHMWDMIEAEVVCRELNCGTATETTTDGKYGPGGVYSGLDSFQCKGNETQLLQCAYLIDRHEHSFLADCGVKCSGEK
ncbi:hypothetical protein XELAEV_18035898mg, partial [Xenopus laevis]